MESNKIKYRYNNRRYVVAGTVILLFLIFVIRLFYLQIVSDDYKKWADSNAFQKRTLYPSRGVIYDRNGKLLVFNQPSYDVMVIMREIRSFDTIDFCRTVGITKEFFDNRMEEIKKTKGYSSYVSQLFMSPLSVTEYGVLQEKLYKFPGFYIRNRALREYGYHCAANVLGYNQEVSLKDIENDDYYVPRDYIGRAGVERSYEKILRGSKGTEILLRDAIGRIKGKFEEGKHDIEPVSGKNITLSIDVDLQAYGEKLMQNKPGAIVMIEPATGEILCLVTSPSYDPNLLAIGRQFGQNYQLLNRDPLRPLFDRSIMGIYPPGSTFKPAQALAFLQEGVITKDKTYACYSGYPVGNYHLKCHSHNSPLSLVPSLATSCNAYYCWGLHDMLDSRSRYKTIQEAYDVWRNYIVAMGYGNPLGVDLPGEESGFIPSSGYYDKNKNYKRWYSGSIISIAIGQGEIGVTPVQICNLAAEIANRGYSIVPHIVREIQDMPLEEIYRTKKNTGVNKEYYDYVVEGMRAAVLYGTCTGIALYDTEVCAKTGTVQNPHGRDHSACIAFAPMNNPKVAIAVFSEKGGYGRDVAIPVAKLMLEKYLYGDLLEWDRWLEYKMLNWSTLPGSINYIKKIVEDEIEDAE